MFIHLDGTQDIYCSLCKVLNMVSKAVVVDLNKDDSVRYAWCEPHSNLIDGYFKF